MARPALFRFNVYPLLFKILSFICLLLLSQHTAIADTFTVTNNSDSGIGSFRQAVLTANTNPGADTIVFGSVTGTININSVITVTDDLTITGPGVDALTLNSTVTSGTDTLFLASGGSGSRSLVITDLTFQQDPVTNKQLIRAESQGTVTIRNAKLLGNGKLIAASSGGAIAVSNTDVLIQNSVIDNFRTTYRGAGVFMLGTSASDSANLVVEDSLFSNNITAGGRLESVASKNGGAIASEESTSAASTSVTVKRSSFIANSTSPSEFGSGGAIFFEDDILIEQCYFFHNSARHGGGAIYTQQSSPNKVIRDSLFEGNVAGIWGGALYIRGNMDMESTTLHSNLSASRGGGLYHEISGIVNIVNSTFSANHSDNSGGAIEIDPTAPGATRVNLLHVSVIGNSATAQGGGIQKRSSDNDFRIINSVIAGNTAGTTDNEVAGQAVIDFSLIGDDAGDASAASYTEFTPGNSIFDMDPMLDVLADNGGPMAGRDGAMPIPTHAVLANSIIIGAADASATNSNIALPATDQRGAGFARIKDGGLEMGAVEFDTPVITGASSGSGSGSLSWWLMSWLLVPVMRRRCIV